MVMAPRPMRETSSPPSDACFIRYSLSWRRSGGGVVVGQVAAQFAGGVGLGEQFAGLGLGGLDGVRAGDEARQRPLLVGDAQQGPGELGRVARLPAVHALPELDRGGGPRGVVVDGQLGPD